MNWNISPFPSLCLINQSVFQPAVYQFFPYDQNQCHFTQFQFMNFQNPQLPSDRAQVEANTKIDTPVEQNPLARICYFAQLGNEGNQKEKQNSQQLVCETKMRENQVKSTEIGCQCRMSNCAKYYCFCFKNGKGCHDKCSCLNCKNHQNRFKQKKRLKKKKQVLCNCSKTECLKKYCECYALGKKCGKSCKCLNCQN